MVRSKKLLLNVEVYYFTCHHGRMVYGIACLLLFSLVPGRHMVRSPLSTTRRHAKPSSNEITTWTDVKDWPDEDTLLQTQQQVKAEIAALNAAIVAEDYSKAARCKVAVASLRAVDPVWSLRNLLQSAIEKQDFALAASCQSALRRLRSARPRLLWRDALVVLRGGREIWTHADGGRSQLLYSAPPLHSLAQPVWSPEGEMIAVTEVGGGKTRVVVIHAESGREVASAPTPPIIYLRWSTDSQLLTFLHLAPSRTVGMPPLVLGSLEVLSRKATYLRPGGPFFYALGNDGGLLVHDGFRNEVSFLSNGLHPPDDVQPPPRVLTSAPASFCTPVLEPMCRYAAFPEARQLIAVDLANGKRFQLEESAATPIAQQLLISPDGARLAVLRRLRSDARGSEAEQELLVLSGSNPQELFTGGAHRQLLPSYSGKIVAAWFSPDSSKLLCLEGADTSNTDPAIALRVRPVVWSLPPHRAVPTQPDALQPAEASGYHYVTFSEFTPSAAVAQTYFAFFDQFAQSVSPWSPVRSGASLAPPRSPLVRCLLQLARVWAQDSSAFCFASSDGRVRVHRLSSQPSAGPLCQLVGANFEELDLADFGSADLEADVAWWSPC